MDSNCYPLKFFFCCSSLKVQDSDSNPVKMTIFIATNLFKNITNEVIPYHKDQIFTMSQMQHLRI